MSGARFIQHLRSRPQRLWRYGLGGLAAFFVLGLLAWEGLRFVPLPPALFAPPTPSTELTDCHGTPLRPLRGPEGFGQEVDFRQIPPVLVAATLSAEDKRFWSHPGVDWRATLRAAWDWLRYGHIVSGASTITEQLIKLSHPRPRTLRSKFIEAVQALRLEQVWSKQRILTAYFNRLDYGNLCVGCAEAARVYFGKPLADLSVAEAALLAALPQAPTRLNPYHHFARAHRRQQWILKRMWITGRLTQAEYRRARAEPLHLQPREYAFRAPHFVDLVLQRDALKLAKHGPGRVRTTLDLELNRFATDTLRRHLARLHQKNVRNGAIVVIDNPTGGVLALVGSVNYFSPTAGQVNGAWAPRSPGSTLKPFTYLLAFEHGATAASIVADVPTDFPTPTGIYRPVNYDHRCYGPVRYRLALANSLNIPAVKVLASIGGPAVLQQLLQRCGLTTLNRDPNYYGLGLTLGNADVRLLELVNAYAALARLGRYEPYHLLASPAGKPPALQRVGNPNDAWLVADILRDNAARTLAFGPDSELRFSFPVACKTGTSSDFRDNWAIGYTPQFTVGVWVGNFDNSPMRGVSGVTGAAPVLHDVFEYLHRRFGTTWYHRPAGVVVATVDPLTGHRVSPHHPGAVSEKFLPGTLPPPAGTNDYDAQGRVRLPAEYADWFHSGDNWLAGRAVLTPAKNNGRLRLITPLPGTTYFLDPDLPDDGRWLPLEAAGPTNLIWKSRSLQVRQHGTVARARLVVGTHHLTAINPATGQRLETWITVKRL